MRTIIIEDNNLMLEATKIIIEKNDYLNIVEAFNDGNKALERLEELHPKVVFLDV
ncbi:response regulator [Clostridium sp.]|uniref:response regulator n=1 Tax=Clostridium sp. TaxID=1506 RepID=UPI0025E2D627|nr:response regulator [Clostridium sp.]MDY2629843.1 response regulator [Clostridium sp.]